jgi:hypothetical protein
MTTSLQDYCAIFLRHATLTGFNETSLIAIFRMGLKPHLQRALATILEPPESLADFMEITTRLECNTVRNPQSGPPSPSFRPFPRQENITMDVDAIRKKLTEQERSMLRAQRGCFSCQKINVNHLASNCPENNTTQGNALATLTAQVSALTQVLALANKGLSPYFSRSRPFVACTVANTAIPALISQCHQSKGREAAKNPHVSNSTPYPKICQKANPANHGTSSNRYNHWNMHPNNPCGCRAYS